MENNSRLSEYSRLSDFEELWEDPPPGFHPKTGDGSSPSVSSDLVLDTERGGVVEADAAGLSVERKGMSAERSIATLRSHSEAERKRRARINSHLDTLRNLVPATEKMDKASLLGEVIAHLRGLKRRAAEASSGYLVPTDIDEVRVERQAEGLNGAPFLIKASLCCDSKPGLLSDLRQVLDDLPLIVVRAEIATLGGRMNNAFVITSCREGSHGEENAETQQFLASSVQQALRSILNKFSPPQEFSSRSALSNKRRRLSLFSHSMSSSSEDLW